MKKLILSLVCCLMTVTGFGANVKWGTDLPAAKAQAQKEKKIVLVNFTGSDWCPWCIKLKDEIFSKPEFIKYAEKKLVLVEIDFPRKKELPQPLKTANDELAKQYKIAGFPTVVVLGSDGKRLGDLGYEKGGPKAFLAELEKLKK